MKKKEAQAPLRAILIGAGSRGKDTYGQWALDNPGKLIFTAVAEPSGPRRSAFAKAHKIPEQKAYLDWKEMLDKEQGAEVCLVCTSDREHTEPALAALNAGYHVLLEKPMAVRKEDCLLLAEASHQAGKELRICHVLRYTPIIQAIKKALDQGLLGEIMSIRHSENVAWWHYAHSYVRGNWGNQEASSPFLLAKSCHDLDILYYLTGRRANSLQSFAALNYYTEKNAPEGAPLRCTDGCPARETCLFYAPRFYVDAEALVGVTQFSPNQLVRFVGKAANKTPWLIRLISLFYPPAANLLDWRDWPIPVITDDYSKEGRLKSLETGPYGRCVFRADNNVADSQVVNIQYEGGLNVSFTLHGHSHLDGREIRIDGTKASLKGEFSDARKIVTLFDHRTGKQSVLYKTGISIGGHGGGDVKLMESFVHSLRNPGASESLTSAEASLESHMMAFAAEISLKEGRVVSMSELKE